MALLQTRFLSAVVTCETCPHTEVWGHVVSDMLIPRIKFGRWTYFKNIKVMMLGRAIAHLDF